MNDQALYKRLKEIQEFLKFILFFNPVITKSKEELKTVGF